jgi:hypothetical protein
VARFVLFHGSGAEAPHKTLKEIAVADWSEKFEQEVEDLRRVRDEMRVQAELGKAEAKERWDALEKRWDHLEARLKVVGREAGGSAKDVAKAAKSAGEAVGKEARGILEEIKRGYVKIKDVL